MHRLIMAAVVVAILAAAPAAAHIPEDCRDSAMERYRAEEAVIDALESLGKLVSSRAPMPEIDLGLSAVFGRFIEYSDADLRLAECMADAE
ncbi:MAG: hypothetical protein OXK82_05555 [Deltaproteobacteria bacterium]|nr:hypothetical protein [Deltaproteobacteria bacterium]